MIRTLFSAVAVCSLALAACHTGEPTSPAGGISAPYNPPTLTYGQMSQGAATTADVQTYNMYTAESVRHFCAGPDPMFSFNSAMADSDKQPTLQTLAECMKTGALAGKRIALIGRTDPRGTDQYNEKLGLERAERVKRYLVANGVDGSRIDTSSLGKTDASPAPKDWPTDRRVEISLAP